MTTQRVVFVVDGPIDQPTGGYLYDRIVIDGLRALGANVEVVNLHCGGAASLFRENARVRALLSAPDEPVVVIDELCHPRAFVGVAWAERPRRATLVTLVHHLAASERAWPWARARAAFERPLLTQADGVIVTSETTKVTALALGSDRARTWVVRPGRDRLGTRSAPPPRSPDGRLRLLYVGALTARKGVLDLLSAFDAVAGRATLTVAGPADRDHRYAAHVLRAAAHHPGAIRVTGTLSDGELASELARHDVLVLPSRYEGFGIVLAEAMSYGLAMLATRAGAIPEVVRDGREAVLVDPGDTTQLARALVGLVASPERVDAMRADALVRASKLPTWRETTRAFASALAFVPHVRREGARAAPR